MKREPNNNFLKKTAITSPKAKVYVIPYFTDVKDKILFMGQKQVISYHSINQLTVNLKGNDKDTIKKTMENDVTSGFKGSKAMGKNFNGMLLPSGGHLACFGGNVDKDETHFQTIRRELEEEFINQELFSDFKEVKTLIKCLDHIEEKDIKEIQKCDWVTEVGYYYELNLDLIFLRLFDNNEDNIGQFKKALIDYLPTVNKNILEKEKGFNENLHLLIEKRDSKNKEKSIYKYYEMHAIAPIYHSKINLKGTHNDIENSIVQNIDNFTDTQSKIFCKFFTEYFGLKFKDNGDDFFKGVSAKMKKPLIDDNIKSIKLLITTLENNKDQNNSFGNIIPNDSPLSNHSKKGVEKNDNKIYIPPHLRNKK